MADVAENAQEHSYDWWGMMTSLRQTMLNLAAAGLFHLIEQQLTTLSRDGLFRGEEPEPNTRTGEIGEWYRDRLGIDFAALPSWRAIHEMPLVANTVKHGEGGSAENLRHLRPELFTGPAYAELLRQEGLFADGRLMSRERLTAPLSGEDFFVRKRFSADMWKAPKRSSAKLPPRWFCGGEIDLFDRPGRWRCNVSGMRPITEILSASISAVTDNGEKLLEDAKLLFESDRYSTALALAVLAQEEFAKGFLLVLVRDDVLPWIPEIHRSIARHHCKHLLGIVMEWLPPVEWGKVAERYKQWTEKHDQRMAWFQRQIDRYKRGLLKPDPEDPEPAEPDIAFPDDVADALNIYRHEEIERLRFGYAPRDEQWAGGRARRIADGLLDRKKQSAIYVDISRSGQVGLHPGLITREDAADAIRRAQQLAEVPEIFSDEYKALSKVIPAIFANLTNKSSAKDPT